MTKQFILKKSVLAVAMTLATSQYALAQADTAPIQKVVVTGSNIKRIDSETASPVTVLRREEIKATGATTVRQVLDTLTSFDTGTLRDDGSATSFARGASGASMRGLGKGATLVLVNGRRVSNYAFADGGQDVFVNVDSIPADVIERVEVLKDGASAIYGSDAMSGVINIITRSTYQGIGVSGSIERPQSHKFGGQQTAGLVGGFGNLEADGFNVFANLEAYKRHGYMQNEIIGSYPAWHKKYVSPAFGDPSLFSFPGNLNEPRAGTRAAIRTAVASCPASRVNTAGLCTSDLTGITQSSDSAERLNFFSQAKFKLGSEMRGFAEVAYSTTKTEYRSLPYANAAGSPTNWFNGYLKRSESVAKPKLAVGNPANPYSFPVGIDYRFMDNLDMWKSPSEANQYRVMAGINGPIERFGFEWEVAAGRVGGDAESRDHGAHRDRFPAAVSSGEYVIGGPNSQELLDRMFPVIGTDAKISQDFVDGKLTGEVMTLAGGPLSFAIGGEFRRESMYIKSTDNVVNAEIIGRGSLFIDGQRDLSAVFLELDAPVTKKLVVNAALRADKADGFDGHVSPKVGVRYTVTPKVLLRGTVAGGFRAPNIPETLGKVGLTGFFNSTLDPKRCDTATRIRDILATGTSTDRSDATVAYNSGCLTSVPAMISSSSSLKPETSKSLTLGFVAEPVKNVNFAMDYYRIEREDEIAYRPVSYVLQREDNAPYSQFIVRNPVSDTDRRLADRANVLSPGANLAFTNGNIQSLLLSYENFGKTLTSGIDLDLSGRLNMGANGTLTVGLMSTIALKLQEWDIDAGAFRPNTIGLRGNPKYTNVLSAVWKKGTFATSVRINRTSRTELNFDETDEARWNEAGCIKNVKPTDDLPCYTAASMRTDLNFVYSGFKNTRLTVNVRNALKTSAPVDLRGGYALRPRSIKVAAEYSF
ncbi:TonB-dependent receptor [Massilia sp. PAMC28688]|uniref:TonB-dependent receptor plug domain-containing protein n=1 Tax=Massilia sp. PAMC28688 TaxID=2861283 RepID=UPI001C63B755|nr:TonB-dependent receptor [Massilia sp. PAMC28688]QYF94243.1 TonB-dependent receptor [Massilia sp. PAMC28688]